MTVVGVRLFVAVIKGLDRIPRGMVPAVDDNHIGDAWAVGEIGVNLRG